LRLGITSLKPGTPLQGYSGCQINVPFHRRKILFQIKADYEICYMIKGRSEYRFEYRNKKAERSRLKQNHLAMFKYHSFIQSARMMKITISGFFYKRHHAVQGLIQQLRLGAAGLGHIGPAAAAAAHDDGYLLDDIAGMEPVR